MFATRRHRRTTRRHKRFTFRNRTSRTRFRRSYRNTKKRIFRKARNINTQRDKYTLQYVKTIVNHLATSNTWASGGNIDPTPNGVCLSQNGGYGCNFLVTDMMQIYANPPNNPIGGSTTAAFFQNMPAAYYFHMYKFWRISKVVVRCNWDMPREVISVNSGNWAGDSTISAGSGTHAPVGMGSGAEVNLINAQPTVDEIGRGNAGNAVIDNTTEAGTPEGKWWGTRTGRRGLCCVWYPGIQDIGQGTISTLPQCEQHWMQQNNIRRMRIGKPFKMVWTPRIRTPIFNDPNPTPGGTFILGTTRKMPWFSTNATLLQVNNTLQGAPIVKTIGNFTPGVILFMHYKIYFKFRDRVL